MAYVRTNAAGTRFTGMFRDSTGARLSAGTYDTKEEALRQAEAAEEHGMVEWPPAMTIKAWAEKFINETPTLSDRTKQDYRSYYRRLINPEFGDRLVGDLQRREVRAFLDRLYREGTGAATVNRVMCALACIYKPLVVDDLLASSPTDKIPNYSNQRKGFELVELDEFTRIREHLPNAGSKLFAEFLISLGLRFGEATEVRVGDISQRRGITSIHVQRVVSDVGAKNNSGSRFKVLQGTKGKWNARKTRKVTVPRILAEKITQWVSENRLGRDDLLFPGRLVEPDDWRRRHSGNTTGHLPRDTWRRMWVKAVTESKIGWTPRPHDLRHACASHMLAAGASLQEVKETLGHSSITTTQIYLHSLPGTETDAFDSLLGA